MFRTGIVERKQRIRARGKNLTTALPATECATRGTDQGRSRMTAMVSAGSSLLRTTMVRAADHARKQDPHLLRISYVQMVERG